MTADSGPRIVMVGFGYWGPNLMRNLSASRKCSLVGLCDPRAEARSAAHSKYPGIRTFDDFDRMLEADGIDALVIASPSALHPRHASSALAAGKHVFVEKPLAETVAEAVRINELAQRMGLTLMVGHTFLYNNLVHDVKARIDSGDLGEVYCAYSQRLNLGRFRQDSDVLWTLAPHDISILNHWFGAAPKKVRARGHTYVHRGSNVAEVCYADMDYADGRNAHMHLSWLDPQKRRDMIVVGSRKMLIYDDMNPDQHIRVYDKSAEADHQSTIRDFADFGTRLRAGDLLVPNLRLKEPLAAEMDHFIDCIVNRRPPLTDGTHAIMVTAVLEAMTRSMQAGGAAVEVEYPEPTSAAAR